MELKSPFVEGIVLLKKKKKHVQKYVIQHPSASKKRCELKSYSFASKKGVCIHGRGKFLVLCIYTTCHEI